MLLYIGNTNIHILLKLDLELRTTLKSTIIIEDMGTLNFSQISCDRKLNLCLACSSDLARQLSTGCVCHQAVENFDVFLTYRQMTRLKLLKTHMRPRQSVRFYKSKLFPFKN